MRKVECTETIEDIIDSLYGDVRKQLASWEDTINTRKIVDAFRANLAERLLAARKREREATSKKSLQVGNAAKMRNALEKLSAVDLSRLKFPLDGDSSAIYNSDKKEITIPYWRVAELLNEVKMAQDMAKSSLAKPPRNCDIMDWRTAWAKWRTELHPQKPCGYGEVVSGTEQFLDWYMSVVEGGAE